MIYHAHKLASLWFAALSDVHDILQSSFDHFDTRQSDICCISDRVCPSIVVLNLDSCSALTNLPAGVSHRGAMSGKISAIRRMYRLLSFPDFGAGCMWTHAYSSSEFLVAKPVSLPTADRWAMRALHLRQTALPCTEESPTNPTLNLPIHHQPNKTRWVHCPKIMHDTYVRMLIGAQEDPSSPNHKHARSLKANANHRVQGSALEGYLACAQLNRKRPVRAQSRWRAGSLRTLRLRHQWWRNRFQEVRISIPLTPRDVGAIGAGLDYGDVDGGIAALMKPRSFCQITLIKLKHFHYGIEHVRSWDWKHNSCCCQTKTTKVRNSMLIRIAASLSAFGFLKLVWGTPSSTITELAYFLVSRCLGVLGRLLTSASFNVRVFL